MDNEKMGKFILELRKSHQMTQKELAIKLNVSDKAVSKWERGLSSPDISLLLSISNILGVTTTELLNGERTSVKENINVETVVANALEYGEKTAKRKINLTKSVWSAVFTILLLIGISVVSIVNVAISGTFTWSLIPISAIIFTWLVFFPSIKFGMNGIIGSLIAFSLFIAPFLFVLDYTIKRITGNNQPVFEMGIRIAPLSIVFIWVAFFLLKKLKTRKLFAIALLVLIASPISFLTNIMIAGIINQPLFSGQIIINALTLVLASIILFIIELVIRKKS